MKNETSKKQTSLRNHAFGMIVVLFIQYLLGMLANLYIQFPQNEHEGQLWVFAWHQVPLALHIIIGFLLLIGTLALLIRAIVYKNNNWIRAAGVAFVAVIAAVVGGSIFIPTQTNIYSLLMAVSFIIALLSYFWGIYNDK